MMNLIAIICLTVSLWLLVATCCDALGSMGNWTESIPQLRAHSAFYPHPHLRDLKSVAKRGKILVITLFVTAGLVVLVSTSILRGGKEKTEADTAEAVDLAELRACVTVAVVAGKHGLAKSREEALSMALSAYASERGIEWGDEISEHSSSVTCNIGRDRVTMTISGDGLVLEIHAVCGNVGARAIANTTDGSVESSVFTSNALERELSG
jgi:hypothetical protein